MTGDERARLRAEVDVARRNRIARSVGDAAACGECGRALDDEPSVGCGRCGERERGRARRAAASRKAVRLLGREVNLLRTEAARAQDRVERLDGTVRSLRGKLARRDRRVADLERKVADLERMVELQRDWILARRGKRVADMTPAELERRRAQWRESKRGRREAA